MKILIIDDDPSIQLILGAALEKYGDFHVIHAERGLEGLELAGRHQPDLILLDIMMHDLNGPSVLQKLSEEKNTRDIPVIFLTGKDRPEEEASLLGLGARAVITKPFDPLQMVAVVKELIKP